MQQGGTKHEGLNREAYGIGGLIQEGHLLESVALAALSSALADIRHRSRDFRAAEQTLRTAFRAGVTTPRAVPERPPMAMDDELVGGDFIAKLKTAAAKPLRKARLQPEAAS